MNRVFRCVKQMFFLSLVIILFVSCLSEEEKRAREEAVKTAQKELIALDAYHKIMQYAIKNNIGESSGSVTGYISGSSSFTFNRTSISVYCTFIIPLTGTINQGLEIGDLTKIRIDDTCGFSDCSGHYPVSIQARWENRMAGDGDLVITISDSNVLKIYIFGDGDWKYHTFFYLNSANEILGFFNDAKKNIAEIDGEEFVPVSLANEAESITLKPGGVYKNETNKDILIYIYPDEIVTTPEGGIAQNIRIEGYAPIKDDNNGNIDENESFARGAKLTKEADLVLKDGKLYDKDGIEVGTITHSNYDWVQANIESYMNYTGGDFELLSNTRAWYEGKY